jgi:hypothetical protein
MLARAFAAVPTTHLFYMFGQDRSGWQTNVEKCLGKIGVEGRQTSKKKMYIHIHTHMLHAGYAIAIHVQSVCVYIYIYNAYTDVHITHERFYTRDCHK